jgi:hypothetical protein
MTSPIPHTWQVPEVFRERMGNQAGRQRCMTHAGHLLVILHELPDPDAPQRPRRSPLLAHPRRHLEQSSSGGPPASPPLRAHVETFVEAAARLEALSAIRPTAPTTGFAWSTTPARCCAPLATCTAPCKRPATPPRTTAPSSPSATSPATPSEASS